VTVATIIPQPAAKEAGCDTLDGSEVKSHPTQTGVNKSVEDGDGDDEGERVQVVDNIVWHAAQVHGGRL